MPIPISAIKGVIWPALPNPNNSLLLALQYQLEQTQWWSPEEIQKWQMFQLTALLAHADHTVPFYRQRLGVLLEVRDRFLNYSDLQQIPILTRQDIQQQSKEMISTALPKEHLPTSESQTSGSTGRPITFQTTKIKGIFYRALNLRSHLWHQRNFSAKVAAIRVPRSKLRQSKQKQEGKKIWADAFPSGALVELDSGKTIAEQLAWLEKENPEHILTYPSNLLALAKQAKKKGIKIPNLQALSTFGEVVTPEIRQVCQAVWNISIVDIYSCQEIGLIALQCPKHEHYHIQSESVIVEILDENDQPCAPGQIGRVVLTDLHNYAMPFIRYEIGDYAEMGEYCSCGRKLPVLRRILGRSRNLLVLPSGDLIWPSYILSNWAKLGPILQIQVIQRSVEVIEVRMVLSRAITENEEAILHQHICADLKNQFQVKLLYVDEILRAANGKYEDFISEVVV
ncbi:MAG: phenylacetate--CoA ligase family protein [Okeania sp. SIO2G4]|uniref:phenylacetate--CoA ligase family protein n=1 Tax=unclassified Okeania TaxID=2634635 RepID=UPI0013BC6F71|nr:MULTISPECIES: hypothetical protein [unclassified Okeania]NEP05092.1 phenylacetate--CoA ligase family protein [Okeania sp. SIO4D6]NEP70751.1 phenylacetate--CoA ligase family protein [Okeania sp. SIO2G5]NEP95803.1 phenylacetate--CoA ligase family protein [Okeania sp. SIO2F5]NEQ89831.1 phenylacetate--CoA ligase family protein [Okeania sp. SIO2G4]